MENRGERHLVWAHKHAQTTECPKSFVTAESMAIIEEFFVRRRLGIQNSLETEARKMDGFLILSDEMEHGDRDGTSQH